jgi:hypothetical protein
VHCDQPTFFGLDDENSQMPTTAVNSRIEDLPDELDTLYAEARGCIAVGAHTAALMVCRKILMNVAVVEGAAPGSRSRSTSSI